MQIVVNGQTVEIPPEWHDDNLLFILRELLGLVGARYGCGAGFCGACTVLLDDVPVRSCLTPLSGIADRSVRTVEGLSSSDQLHSVQKAWLSAPIDQDCRCCPGRWFSPWLRLLPGNPQASRASPGFIAIVRSDALLMGNSQGIGVIASTPASLDRIEAALGAEWTTEEKSTDQDIAGIMDIDRRIARRARRDSYVNDDAVSDVTWDVDMRIDIPPAAHASIAPLNWSPRGRASLSGECLPNRLRSDQIAFANGTVAWSRCRSELFCHRIFD